MLKATQVLTCDFFCVGRLTSCSIRFTLNRCDLTSIAQGYQAVLRIHLPSTGLAWPGLSLAKPIVCRVFIWALHFTVVSFALQGQNQHFLLFTLFSDQLFHVLAMHMRLYSIDLAYNPWTKLTQVTQSREAQWVTLSHSSQPPPKSLLSLTYIQCWNKHTIYLLPPPPFPPAPNSFSTKRS